MHLLLIFFPLLLPLLLLPSFPSSLLWYLKGSSGSIKFNFKSLIKKKDVENSKEVHKRLIENSVFLSVEKAPDFHILH